MQHFGSISASPLLAPRLLIVADTRNPKAVSLAEKWKHLVLPRPNCILVIGGDGHMIRTIRRLWHKRLPFVGLNAGHVGYLLNDPSAMSEGFPTEFIHHHLPLLEVETVSDKGVVKRHLAFNDAFVERAQSQTAWIEIKVDGKVRLSKLVADGALVATPAGSTAYARAMGASPLPLTGQALVLTGSNVMLPARFKPCYLPLDSAVDFTAIDPAKRPLFGVVDGVRQGKVSRLSVMVSSTASVQLAFASGNHTLTEKLSRIQFPEEP